ncbi:MAG TPA: hypothetical protein H9700_09935 [Candidatus Eisenbergiella intestinipullorum]|nr:hypothetical protein [Candidatus Eisenbergiella intestinipullorum]
MEERVKSGCICVHAGAAMHSSMSLALHLAVGLRPMGIFAEKLLRKQACTQLHQTVVHAGAAMRSSIPLRFISLSGFALCEYLQKLCSVSKLPGAVFTNIPAWLNFRNIFEKSPCIFRKHPV